MFLLVGLAVVAIITGLLAQRKGYNFFCWVLAAGIIGLLILAFLPFTNREGIDTQRRQQLIRRGNVVGIILSTIAIIVAAYTMLTPR